MPGSVTAESRRWAKDAIGVMVPPTGRANGSAINSQKPSANYYLVAGQGRSRVISTRASRSSVLLALRFRHAFLLEPERQRTPDLFRLGDAVASLDVLQ